MKGNDVQEGQATTIILDRITESVSRITIDFSNRKGESVLSAEAELQSDTSPWTITIRTEISEDCSAQDVTQLLHDSWIVEEMLEELIDTLASTVKESENSSEGK